MNPCSSQPPSKIFDFVIFSIILRKLILHFKNNKVRDDSEGNVVFMGCPIFLGPWEMVTGEWKNLLIIDGSFEKKMGSFCKVWSYRCSHGYG